MQPEYEKCIPESVGSGQLVFFIRYGIYHIPLDFFSEGLFPYLAIIFYANRTATADTVIRMHEKFHCSTKFFFNQLTQTLHFGMSLTYVQIPGNRHMAVDM